MIRVYYLPVLSVDGTDQVAGIEFIHNALLECSPVLDDRKLTQDTTPDEDVGLSLLAIESFDATQEEIDRFFCLVSPYLPDLTILRAQELLATSPAAITMPEIWELLRIYGRLLGIPE